MTDQTELPIRATLKAGGGYDAPWLTVAGTTASEVAFKLKEVVDQDLAEVVAHAARRLAGVWTAVDVLGAKPVEAEPVPQPTYQQQAPAQQHYQQPQQQAAPQGQPAPQCRHGARVLKEGTSKAGKPYSGWMCGGRDRNDQCEPIWNRG